MAAIRLNSVTPILQVAYLHREYGMRDGRLADPDGNEIGIGENLVRD